MRVCGAFGGDPTPQAIWARSFLAGSVGYWAAIIGGWWAEDRRVRSHLRPTSKKYLFFCAEKTFPRSRRGRPEGGLAPIGVRLHALDSARPILLAGWVGCWAVGVGGGWRIDGFAFTLRPVGGFALPQTFFFFLEAVVTVASRKAVAVVFEMSPFRDREIRDGRI